MQLTKLRAAPVLRAEVPPCAPAGRMDGGTASQLIRGVRRTSCGSDDDSTSWNRYQRFLAGAIGSLLVSACSPPDPPIAQELRAEHPGCELVNKIHWQSDPSTVYVRVNYRCPASSCVGDVDVPGA